MIILCIYIYSIISIIESYREDEDWFLEGRSFCMIISEHISEIVQPGEYLQPMLLNTIVERNLYESEFSPRAGSRQTYIINTNDFFVQLKRGETLGTLVR